MPSRPRTWPEEEAKVEDANVIIRKLAIDFEEIRTAEVMKASKCVGKMDADELLDDLTHSIVSRISAELIKNLRKAAANDDKDVIEAAKILFDANTKQE